MGYAVADQEKALRPFNTEQDLMSDRFARETTLYSQQNQSELDSIINKINSGITLSEGEKNRAQQLAIAEQGYKQALEVAKMGQNNSPYEKLSGGETLYNTQTGKVQYQAPYKATGGGGSGGLAQYYGNNTSTNKGAVYTPPASFRSK